MMVQHHTNTLSMSRGFLTDPTVASLRYRFSPGSGSGVKIEGGVVDILPNKYASRFVIVLNV